MTDNLLNLIQKYRKKGILTDTNVLLLYLVGSYDQSLISRFGRTANFTEDDFLLVSKFIEYFEIKITTPHILTEVSNLFGNRAFLNEALIKYLSRTDEIFAQSAEVSKNEIFIQFGLADTAIFETSKNSYLVFTDEKPLLGYLLNKGVDVVSLDQVRMI